MPANKGRANAPKKEAENPIFRIEGEPVKQVKNKTGGITQHFLTDIDKTSATISASITEELIKEKIIPPEAKGITKIITENRVGAMLIKEFGGGQHRQPRSYLKTAGAGVGRERTDEQGSLFDTPRFETAINPYRATLSKNTAITGHLLIALWQGLKNDKGVYIIENLTHMADQLKVSTQELKLYLVCLGGYSYPAFSYDKTKEITSVENDLLFHIKFNTRYKEGDERGFTEDNRIGTRLASFVKDRDVLSVEVRPSLKIQIELENRRGFGNLLVDNSFVAFSLGLSDLAYKILCYSGSNKPDDYKIGFKKLILPKHLNLKKQVFGVKNKAGKLIKKGAGKKRILEKIIDALNELKAGGHLKEWFYDKDKDMFSWTYSDKIFKHPSIKYPLKKDATEQTGQTQTRQDT